MDVFEHASGHLQCYIFYSTSVSNHRRSQGAKGAMPPTNFIKHSDFVLWEAFFQTK